MTPLPYRVLLPLLAALAATVIWLGLRQPAPEPVRLGVVHALSGVMADSESRLVEALQLAAEELNAAGGVLGRPLELVVVDSRSDAAHAAQEAERLIRQEGVQALFGCWTSVCRKAVLPMVERHRSLLFYPLQYEGMEQSEHIVYLGAAPNQQIIPGAHWAMERFGRRIYLVGSDYVFPRTANRLIRDLARAGDGEVVAERYLPLAATDFDALVEDIRNTRPDVVLNTINGVGNRHFFNALAQAGLGELPVVSFSVAEPELRMIGEAAHHPAHHAVWGYFQSLPGETNARFVARLRQRFGADRVSSDPVVSSHTGLMLWAAAARRAGTTDPGQVSHSVAHTSLSGPAGIVAVDSTARHTWRRVFVGHARPDGLFDATEISETAIRPAPFPPYHSRAYWLRLVAGMAASHPADERSARQ